MNRNFRGDDDQRRIEGRWEPRMNRFGNERDWNERAFGEDFADRRDYEESYGRDDRFGRRMMERDRFESDRGYGSQRGLGGYYGSERGGMYGGERGMYGGERGMYGGERGMYGGERGMYGSERGFDWGDRGYGGEWGSERGMYRGRQGREGIMDRVRRFFGKGPKNYQRSDERIKEDICDRLSQHEWLDSSDVEVQVSSGEVTLSGIVDDRQSKRMLEDIAEDVFGVKDVHNQIRVDPNREQTQQQTAQRTTTTRTPKA